MTWEIVWEVIRQFGLPAAVGFGLAWVIWSGQLRPKREFEQDQQDRAEVIANYERQIVDLRKDYERQLTAMTTDRDYYRDFTRDTMEHYEREVSTSEAAVRTATRAISRRRS